jgi:hypothetical protein
VTERFVLLVPSGFPRELQVWDAHLANTKRLTSRPAFGCGFTELEDKASLPKFNSMLRTELVEALRSLRPARCPLQASSGSKLFSMCQNR